MIALINYISNYFHSLFFHSKIPINSLKIRKNSEKIRKKTRKLEKVLEEEIIVYCRLLEERSIGNYR